MDELEQEVPEVVDAKSRLKAVFGRAAAAGQAGVVDQDVQLGCPLEELGGGGAHRGERAEVELQELVYRRRLQQGHDLLRERHRLQPPVHLQPLRLSLSHQPHRLRLRWRLARSR